MDQKEGSTFFSAGRITAFAALLTAVGGLVAALVQAGVLGGSRDASGEAPAAVASASPTPDPTGGLELTAFHELLLGYMPADDVGTCEPIPVEDAPGSRAAVACYPVGLPGDGGAVYHLFSDRADLDRYFAPTLRTYEDGSCFDEGGAKERYDYGDDADVGWLLCYTDAGEAWLEWSHESLRVAAYAWTDESGEALYRWWLNESGPVEE